MVHAYYICCKHTAEPCCSKAHHCPCSSGTDPSVVERGEAGAVHHYHSTAGGVQVQTTVRIPAGGGAPIVDTSARHGSVQPRGQLAMLSSGPTSPGPTPPAAAAQRAYEAQAPAYQEHQYGAGDPKPFAVRD